MHPVSRKDCCCVPNITKFAYFVTHFLLLYGYTAKKWPLLSKVPLSLIDYFLSKQIIFDKYSRKNAYLLFKVFDNHQLSSTFFCKDHTIWSSNTNTNYAINFVTDCLLGPQLMHVLLTFIKVGVLPAAIVATSVVTKTKHNKKTTKK